MKKKTRSLSPGAIAVRKLVRHKLAVAAGCVLAFLYFSVLFAGFMAPYPYARSHPSAAHHPPSSIHFFDTEANFHFRPFVYETRLIMERGKRQYNEVDSRRYPIRLFVRGSAYKLLGLWECDIHLFGVDKPALLFVFGSDWNGRDILSRLIFGGRISMTIGLVGVVISISIGLIVGGISGYYGGWVDNLIMRIVEFIMLIPGFYLMLAMRAVLPMRMSSVQIYFMLVIILSFIGWAGMARVIRGIVLSLRESDFVLAAKALGVSDFMIIVRHILPNTASYVIVSATLSIPSYILGESALSLLGLGITEPQVSWGNMLVRAMSITDIKFHPWILTAGVAIFITTMCFNFLGDGLRDAMDPKSGT